MAYSQTAHRQTAKSGTVKVSTHTVHRVHTVRQHIDKQHTVREHIDKDIKSTNGKLRKSTSLHPNTLYYIQCIN